VSAVAEYECWSVSIAGEPLNERVICLLRLSQCRVS
jgi:hypothetical protein